MEWIDVKERLPKENEKVLTYDGYEYRVDNVIKFNYTEEPYIWGHRLVTPWKKVTHWMPLPESPNDIGIGSSESILPADNNTNAFRYTILKNKDE